ncbi:uncharacterized protein DEA37_0008325 [Paragonimus westermani]|uniref:Uncharacterized protein n=1 Tax=Paragonimus westermani TaxID=34504 RepID=A0A5J4NJ51_9TREM|nr:uncharacterized protein DEA37_0008325 [Paragonimus westermani]
MSEAGVAVRVLLTVFGALATIINGIVFCVLPAVCTQREEDREAGGGCRGGPANYRPTTFLSVVSKIMESLLDDSFEAKD